MHGDAQAMNAFEDGDTVGWNVEQVTGHAAEYSSKSHYFSTGRRVVWEIPR